MLSWGRHSNGQLGQGGIEETHVNLPRYMKHLKCPANDIAGIACGYDHTFVILKDGSLLSFGSNDHGQLLQASSRSRPDLVRVLSKVHMIHMACGEGHSVAVTAGGEPVMWGSNSHGELCHDPDNDANSPQCNLDLCFSDTDEDAPAKEELPSLPVCTKVLELGRSVCQVACGANHTVALTIHCDTLAWGSNERGQCSLPRAVKECRKPSKVEQINGTPIVFIASGGAHSFALSARSHVYAWGANMFGQLGVGHTMDQFRAVEVENLQSHGVKYIACGEDHTAMLTETGRLLTFGSGSSGQLGHGGNRHEHRPKHVIELMGSEVTQVACGRRHTLALVGSTGKLYAFGLNGCGQLGTGSTSSWDTPCLVGGQWAPYCGPVCQAGDSAVVSRIGAGGDQSFAVINTVGPPVDMRCLTAEENFYVVSDGFDFGFCTNRPLFLNGSFLKRLSEQYPSTVIGQRFSTLVHRLFREVLLSPGCISQSFQSSEMDDLPFDYADLDSTFDLIRNTDHQLSFQLSDLVPSLSTWLPTTVESCRFFPFVMASPIFKTAASLPHQDFVKFFLSLCHSFCTTNLCQRQAMAKWFNSSLERFSDIIELIKSVIAPMLPQAFARQVQPDQMYSALIFLDFFYMVNDLWFQSVPVEKFYLSGVAETAEAIKMNYFSWREQITVEGQSICLISFPFLLDLQAKSSILEFENNLFRQEVERTWRDNAVSGKLELPWLMINVRRDHIVNDALRQLTRANILGHIKSQDLRKPLKIEFANEEGIDDGGVKKEFFMLLFGKMLSADYGMFQVKSDSNTIYFSPWPDSEEDLETFKLIGMLCGLAIYNNVIIDVAFPTVLYHKLMETHKTSAEHKTALRCSRAGPRRVQLSRDKDIACVTETVDFQMFADVEPIVARTFKNMLQATDDVSEYDISFEITTRQFDADQVIELKPCGSDIPVTNENRDEYVRLYVDYVLHQSVEKQYNSFADGFFQVCDTRCLGLFHPKELQALVIGSRAHDFSALQKVTKYSGMYTAEHPTIKMFWQVFLDFDIETQQKFFQFLTGSDRIPVGGFESMKIIIQSNNTGNNYLPVAHTCFNILDLPMYTSRDVMCHKLLQAMQLAEGFHII